MTEQLLEPTPFDIFCWGIDYGQLLMEEERDSEDWADAFHGAVFARKMCMPANPIERRQPHSQEWRNAKKESFLKFMEYEANRRESMKESEVQRDNS